MSTIITRREGRDLILIDNRINPEITITDTDIDNCVIDITGGAKTHFISGVRFINCTIIADNMRAFSNCNFSVGCEMLIKDPQV